MTPSSLWFLVRLILVAYAIAVLCVAAPFFDDQRPHSWDADALVEALIYGIVPLIFLWDWYTYRRWLPASPLAGASLQLSQMSESFLAMSSPLPLGLDEILAAEEYRRAG